MLFFGTERVSLTLRLILTLVIFDFLASKAQDVNNDYTEVNRKGGGGGGHGSAGSHGGSGSHGSGGKGGGSKGGGKGPRGSPGGRETGDIPADVLLLVGAAALLAINNNNAALAREYEEAAKQYLNGVPMPNVQPNDPPDNVINSPLNYQGAFIYEKNPCQWYQERLTSHKNKRRKKGCWKSAKRFRKKARSVPSVRCPDPGKWGRCFQVANRTGRCYMIVNDHDDSKRHFELINNC